MSALLVSVRTAAEARIALAEGVDLLDRKICPVRNYHPGVQQRSPRIRAANSVGPYSRLGPAHVARLMGRLH